MRDTTKNILFLTHWYPNQNSPSFALFIKKHAQAISRKHRVVVLALSISKSNQFYRKESECYTDEAGLIIHHIYIRSRFNKLLYLFLPLHYWVLNRYIRRNILPDFAFDILHSNILFPCAIVGNWLSKSFKAHHVISEHWSKLEKFFKVSLYRWAGRSALNGAMAITCVSETLRNTIQCYTRNTSIFIVPNVVDATEFYPDPGVARDEAITFIAVAHWGPPKNPFIFLNALRDLCYEGKLRHTKVLLVGTGRQLSEIKSMEYPFDIEYKGNLTPAQLNIEFNKSHIFLHASDFETFSVVIAEALLAGTPSVVSPVGIAHEVINSSNGYIASNTLEEWKAKIYRAYVTVYDRQTISKQLAGKYSSERIANLFDEVYRII